MTASSRRADIVRQIEEAGSASISELSRRFEVSDMTVRRDLEALQSAGLVQRTHGGAVPASAPGIEPRYAAKQRINVALKSRIARYAAETLVDDGQVLLLEGGTTVTSMARHLATHRDLTVVTNGLYTANALRELLPRATVMSTGGILRDVSYTFVGPTVETFLRDLHADTLFVSATGLTVGEGFTDPNPMEAQVRRWMAASAARVVALLDSSKFGVISTTTVAAASDVDVLVTDGGAPAATLEELRRLGVDVRVV
ncbi:DeoR/GlpR family DNA-binding transcription regulator [Agrococcus sediminis]|uniref:DeoR/GlpR family DNA-binding transcription regulator n=1 Tax=Agrococcus TaxID=46352 RepID=UPI00285B8830|nr:DeoR/GlpR family DNA-binding transcription regulator [Agrococcus sp. BE272]MDR7233645.1 DeoR/GlpR family transcriptional regulator of sugar metabolism [Agrococcus sp. BE272]